MTPFEIALAAFDRANALDPHRIAVNGIMQPAELVYSERMTDRLAIFAPLASEALRLAVRAQHLQRWRIPRETYPMNRAGYHRWRGELKRKHAEWAGDILRDAGYSEDTVTRVGHLIRKENLATDSETQTLEDVACLVFLEHYAEDFAAKQSLDKTADILRKTWRKMSPAGQQAAIALPLPFSVRAHVEEARASEPQEPAGATTRSLRNVAVVLATHGDRGGDMPNATLMSQCDALSNLAIFRLVTAGVLNGDPPLEEALVAAQNSGASEIAIYPMFMASGYFSRTVLPARTDAAGLKIPRTILPPLGTDPEMPGLMLSEALATAARHALVPEDCRLLVVGHGSKLGPASANATRAVAAAIETAARFLVVETAFLEEPEFIEDALSRQAPPTVVLGFFSGDGLHAAEDVPEAIGQTGARAVYAGSIGNASGIPALIHRAIANQVGGG